MKEVFETIDHALYGKSLELFYQLLVIQLDIQPIQL